MIDSLERMLDGLDRAGVLAAHGVESREFALVTLHRPALVDDPAQLGAVIDALGGLRASCPFCSPRTRARSPASPASSRRLACA